MKLGLALPHYDFSISGAKSMEWPMVRDWAQAAEELGFDSAWVSDHLFFDLSKYGGSSETQFAMESFSTLAALSVATGSIRLGTLVACNDLRHPALLAKMAATISAWSNGRFELGIGAGWYQPEFRAAGIPFASPAERIDRLAEAVRLIRGMLANPTFSFEGRHYRVKDAWTLPQPIKSAPSGSRLDPGRPPLPVFVGGKGDRIVKIAAQHADGFNTVWAWTPEAYAAKVRLLDKTALAAGRDPSKITKSVGLLCLPGKDESELQARWQRYLAASPGIRVGAGLQTWAADKLAGTPAEIASRMKAFEDAGAEEVILNFGLVPFQICDPSAVEDFVREVRPLMQQRRRGEKEWVV